MFSKLLPSVLIGVLLTAAPQALRVGEIAFAVSQVAEPSSAVPLLAGLCLMAGIARRCLS